MYKGLGEQGEIGCRIFHDFYENDFEPVKETCGYDPRAGETISILKEKGYRLVLATTPWFPKCGIESRMRWAGLDKDAFEFYTTFDSSGYCKPNEGYYWEILERLVLKPEDCLMVGNDVTEDMSAADLGMDVFLMTRNLINKDGVDISGYPQGGFEELLEYIEKE